ncbi:interferon gamma receptor 1-like isoform X2 [Betta splendens]|uniref:Interferon gamma receptor 1-like isoform X2 n=1 Tax=Betta splendens TaxID=158456 RepID=A0A6P7KJV7_BETSP|nr:interferon gamma receptor 1-like isoform X2 [Betta splendens]
MDWGGCAPVVLLLVCLRAAQAYGASLTNVTFHCHNLHNVLKWGYNQSSPGLSFNLYIGTIQPKPGFPKNLWFEPPSQEVDLSFLSDLNNEYLLELTAMIANKSAANSWDLTFSYLKESSSKRKCSVDLPAVNVTALPDANVQFKFKHPWLVYRRRLRGRSNLRHRKRASNSYDSQEMEDEKLPEFYYVVKMDQNHHEFICEDQVCEETLPVDASQKQHCLTIVGDMEMMKVQGTDVYCAKQYQGPKPLTHIVPIVSSALVVFVVAVVAGMVYKKMTKPSESRLRSLVVTNSTTRTMKVEGEEITVPVLEPASPTPLLPEFTSIPAEFTHDHIPRLAIDDEGVVGDAEVEQVSGEEPGYRFINMDDDESENSNQGSGYERRPHVREPTA